VPTVSVNGVALYYEEHGAGDSVLMIPPTGWPGNVWDLEHVPLLSQRYRIICYDQRGIGLSEKPSANYTTSLLAEDAIALLGKLDAIPAHIFGFSTGGQIAQSIALARPDVVRSLVLAASNAGGKGGGGIPLGLAVRLIEHGYGPDYWSRHLTDSDFPFSRAFREGRPEKVRALADAIRARQAPLRMYLQHVIARQTHDTRENLAEIRAPTLVLVGGQDRRTESIGGDHVEMARWLASQIPGAQLREVGRAHHLFAWEEADETARLTLEFFALHSPQLWSKEQNSHV
jgi:pimeloyl-ACP methyl ester carboxylesterase